MANTPHLTQLFQTGHPFTLEIPNPEDLDQPVKIEFWLRKPNVTQYEEGLAKARGKAGRKRAQFRDPGSDDYLGTAEQLKDLDKKDLVAEIMTFEENEMRIQAFNEALYGDNEEEEPRWGKEGQDYLDIQSGLRDRHEEIEKYNSMLAEEDRATMEIKVEEDEEILRLNKIVDEFAGQRDDRLEKLKARKEAELNTKSADDLRKDLMKRMVDLEIKLTQYQEYKIHMVYFAFRQADDHSKLYFKSPDEIWELPDFVRIQLFDAYDRLETEASDLKNLPSPQPS